MTTPPTPQQHVPYQSSVPHVVINPQPTNGLGLAGFITSLVGLVTCGVLSPIGLLLSLIGLMKPPRGFAVAGAIIGAVGSIWMAIAGFAIVMAALGIGAAAKQVADYVAAHQSARQAYLQIEQQRTQTGSVPTSAAANAIAAKFTDPWGMALRAEVSGEEIIVRSAGRDKKFDTSDDIRFSESELQMTTPSTTPSTPRFGRLHKD
jgi:hypothetical protein